MPGFDTHDLVVPDPDWIAGGGHVNERNDAVRDALVNYIKRQLGDRQDLVEKLIPDYAPFARRPVVDNGWYRALTRDNVELVTTPISRLTEHGIETEDGQEREVDLVITAVGFRTTMYLHPTEYRGVGGASLQKLWSKDGPRAHLGMTVPGFPNFFMLYGPNSQPVSGHGSLPAWFEIWTHYIAQCLVAMLEGGFSRIEIRKDTHDDYNTRLDEAAAGLVHLQDAGSRRRQLLPQRVRADAGERALERRGLLPVERQTRTWTTSRSPDAEQLLTAPLLPSTGGNESSANVRRRLRDRLVLSRVDESRRSTTDPTRQVHCAVGDLPGGSQYLLSADALKAEQREREDHLTVVPEYRRDELHDVVMCGRALVEHFVVVADAAQSPRPHSDAVPR